MSNDRRFRLPWIVSLLVAAAVGLAPSVWPRRSGPVG